MPRARRSLVISVWLTLGIVAAAASAAPRSGVGGGASPFHAPQPASALAPLNPAPQTPAVRALVSSLNGSMRQVGNQSGAYVVDLTAGTVLYANRAGVGRLPASVQKLYTTTTALDKFGPEARLTTSVLGTGTLAHGVYTGTLYLRGGGDPTFGSAAFDRANYGPGNGATIQQLAANLVRATGIRVLRGRVVGDETIFDADRGTPATGNRPAIEVLGELSGLSFDRGWSNPYGTAFFVHPAIQAARELIAALRADGVRVAPDTPVSAHATPAGATQLASVQSPTIARLIALTLPPSDNYFAETLLKDLGARFGTGGTTAAGAAVVRAQMASQFGIHPRFNDGSGLSYYDRTSPIQVVTLLRGMAADPAFTNALAVAGETGTLTHEMVGTYAQGRCRGKTGTLQAVSSLAGYCTARDGHTLAFALLMNSVDPTYAHPVQDAMALAIARYDG